MARQHTVPTWILVVYIALAAAGIAALAAGLAFLEEIGTGLAVAGGLTLVVTAATAPIAWLLAQTIERRRTPHPASTLPPPQAPGVMDDRHLRLLFEIRDTAALSEQAKKVIFPQKERQVLFAVIDQHIATGLFDAARELCDAVEAHYGWTEEVAAYRHRIEQSRLQNYEGQAQASATQFEEALSRRDWGAAYREAARIRAMYPDSQIAGSLEARVIDAREEHKRELEQEFLAAADADDVERAVTVLHDLDRYMTREEGERLHATAQEIIQRHRERLGTSFRLAVQEKRWADAARYGGVIVDQYPNTKMAGEVRGMIDLIRTRASQAAALGGDFD